MARPAFETFSRAGPQPYIIAADGSDHTASRAVEVSFAGIVARRPRVAEVRKILMFRCPFRQKPSRPKFAQGFGSNCPFLPTPPPKPASSAGYDLVKQARLNKQAHIANGNTTLSISWSGTQLVAKPVISLSYLLPLPSSVYHRALPLQARPQHSPEARPDCLPFVTASPQTTPLLQGSAQTAHPHTRSGRRVSFLDHTGIRHFYKPPKPKVRGPTFHKHPGSNGISGIHNLNTSRAPPPRGTPGAEQADEECPPKAKEPHAQSRGANRRRARRALYRSWRRQCKQCLVHGAGSRTPVPSQLTKATPRAKWFRQAMLWQHTVQTRHKRKKKVTQLPTTPPLPYRTKLRIGSLNVQGFADTLKLKSALQGHLVILSGNTRDKHAGVGAIISPHLRPYLMDVIQVNNRIVHLCFRKQGGAIHVVGAYAPHAGRDFEADRQPFWETLDEHLSRIPHPEPLYLTGDFNVRFQASHRHDEGVAGPHTYGKGVRYIDHTATSNRSLCIKTMQSLGMVEAASYLTPTLSQQITYRDKAAPPASWEQFILDPLVLQQLYSKIQPIFGDSSLEIAALTRSAAAPTPNQEPTTPGSYKIPEIRPHLRSGTVASLSHIVQV